MPRSDVGYDGNFNLVRPATYLPANIAGVHDIPTMPLRRCDVPASLYPPACVFHLQANSPAIDAGDSLGT